MRQTDDINLVRISSDDMPEDGEKAFGDILSVFRTAPSQ